MIDDGNGLVSFRGVQISSYDAGVYEPSAGRLELPAMTLVLRPLQVTRARKRLP